MARSSAGSPYLPSSLPPIQTCHGLARPRPAVHSPARAGRRRHARRGRACPADRIRSRSRILLRALAAAGELRLVGLAHSIISCARAADATSGSARDLARVARPAVVRRTAPMSRARARRERRSIEDAARTARHEFFERARGTSRRRRRGARPHARRPGRDVSAPAAARRRAARPRGDASAPRRDHPPAARLPARTSCARTSRERRRRRSSTTRSNDDVSIPRNRVRAELLPLLEARFNPAIVDVLADEAELAREAWQWMDRHG